MTEAHPFANTKAAAMMSAALSDAAAKRGISQREIARQLGYKTSTVLSHMANGRAPIPPDRAPDIAKAIGMSEMPFVIAVLEQRYPNLTGRLADAEGARRGASGKDLASDLSFLAGVDLDDLPVSHRRVLREVASDPRAPARWLSVHELPTVALIRELLPAFSEDGLTREQRERLRVALTSE